MAFAFTWVNCSCAPVDSTDFLMEESICEPKEKVCFSTWEEYIPLIKQRLSSLTRSGKETMTLLHCKELAYSDYENDTENMVDMLLSSNSIMPVYFEKQSDPTMMTVHELAKLSEVEDSELIDFTRLQLKEAIDADKQPKLVKFYWQYKNEIYESIALISSDNEIVYDAIGSNYIAEWTESLRINGQEWDVCSPLPTLNEEGSNHLTQNPYIIDIKGNTTIFGEIQYSLRIYCQSIFNNGVLVDQLIEATANHAFGWDCKAECKSSSTLGSSHENVFSWAYGYGKNAKISIMYSGTGFTISGAGTSCSGTNVHRP